MAKPKKPIRATKRPDPLEDDELAQRVVRATLKRLNRTPEGLDSAKLEVLGQLAAALLDYGFRGREVVPLLIELDRRLFNVQPPASEMVAALIASLPPVEGETSAV